MKKVLVTGGAGYIGSHTILALLKAGYQVVSFDNYCNSSPQALQRVKTLAAADDNALVVEQGDILDAARLKEVFAAHQPAVVIHFAGLKAVGESVRLPLNYYQTNVAGTLILCQVMQEAGCADLVFSSSATVYRPEQQMPLSEEKDRFAVNPYGQSKLMVEYILEDFAKANPDWNIALLRYFNPVGADASGQIGEDPNGLPNNLMPFISQVAVGKLDKLSIFGDDYPTQDGTGVRDYIHVSDLAEGHLAAMRYLESKPGLEAFNLGSGAGHSVLEIVKTFEQVNQVPVPYQIVERRPGDAPVSYACPDKSLHLLGWKTKKTLVDMVRDSWNWQKQNPNGYTS